MTEPILTERRVLNTVNKYWTIIAALAVLASTQVIAYLHLQWTVADMKKDQDVWQAGSAARREANHVESDDIKLDIKSLKTDMEWVKVSIRSKQEP